MEGQRSGDSKLRVEQLEGFRVAVEEIKQQINGFYVQNAKTLNPILIANSSVILIENINLICQSKLTGSIVTLGDNCEGVNILKRIRTDLEINATDISSGQSPVFDLEPTPEEKATSNCLVVKEILSYLPAEEQRSVILHREVQSLLQCVERRVYLKLLELARENSN